MKHSIAILLLGLGCATATAHVVTYTETFQDVRVIYPAKSKTTTCKTRVDLSEGLIDNTRGCDVDVIEVYNKNKMWIGSLDGIAAGANKRYEDYDLARYKGKGTSISVEYVFIPEDADESNRWKVSCPAGLIAYIVDAAYHCKKAFSCPNDMYAVDETECNDLPANTRRNKTIGFSCKPGYVMDIDDECIEKAKCSKDEHYDSTYNNCISHPDNAHWIKNSTDWECNVGFILDTYDGCVEKASCSKDERYDASTNSCAIKPKYAHWVDSLTWECDSAYVWTRHGGEDFCDKKATCDDSTRWDSSTNTCVYLPDNAHWVVDDSSTLWECDYNYVNNRRGGCEPKEHCSAKQRYNSYENKCYDPFPHTRWVGSDDDDMSYECVPGYVEIEYGNCELRKHCAHYNADNNTCYEKPDNSQWVHEWGSEWKCVIGYYPESDNSCIKCDSNGQYNYTSKQCVTLPSNAEWVSEGNWECLAGYVSINGTCEAKKTCWFGKHYDPATNTCISKPSNSHWQDDISSTWICNDGYLESNGQCEAKETCWFGKRYNQKTNTCISKPSNSHWVDNTSTYWECDAGYYPSTYDLDSECIKYETSMPNDIKKGAQLAFNTALGGFIVDSTTGEYDDMYNVISFYFTIGGDFHISNRENTFMAALVPSLGYNYVDDFNTTMHIIRLEIGTRFSIGSETTHGYIMPLFITNLGSKSKVQEHTEWVSIDLNESYYTKVIDPKLNDVFFGVEFGVRYMDWESCTGDFYIRVEGPPAKFGRVTNDDLDVLFGMRISI